MVHPPAITEPRSSKKPSPKILPVPDHQFDPPFKQTPAHGRVVFVFESLGSIDIPVDQLVLEFVLDVLLFVVPVHLNSEDIGLPESILAIAPAVAFFVHL